jgi:hypothetical protein
MQVYRVALTHPDLNGVFVADLLAPSADKASKRVKLEAVHLFEAPQLLEADTKAEALVCEWFAGCDRPATGFVGHPVLGDVPVCEHCGAFAASGNSAN